MDRQIKERLLELPADTQAACAVLFTPKELRHLMMEHIRYQNGAYQEDSYFTDPIILPRFQATISPFGCGYEPYD